MGVSGSNTMKIETRFFGNDRLSSKLSHFVRFVVPKKSQVRGWRRSNLQFVFRSLLGHGVHPVRGRDGDGFPLWSDWQSPGPTIPGPSIRLGPNDDIVRRSVLGSSIHLCHSLGPNRPGGLCRGMGGTL